ncbi:hypothetical protein ACET3Z_026372 [Daucus carota]
MDRVWPTKVVNALILKSNRFSGSMPHEICQLSNLHFLDLYINRISGTIPPCLSNLTAMIQNRTEVSQHTYSSSYKKKVNYVSYDPWIFRSPFPQSIGPQNYSYYDNVLARWKGQELEYGQNFAYLKMIDLSRNEMTGEIPAGITRLLDLKGLNLSGNKFYGNISLDIGQLKVLECLDLSINQFSGEIPLSLSGLSFLAYLDLSNNNFWGRIPSGTQLQGFNVSSYEGNTGLCGKPLTKSCLSDKPDDPIQPMSRDYEFDGDDSEYEKWLYISAVLGFSTTFWGMIVTLVLHRRWRHAYFLSLENFKERIYVAMAVRIARLQRKGEIPPSMSGLSFLAFLNPSNNHLSGKIPSGTQLQGFNASTYEGNTGLCGKPLTNICPGDKPADRDTNSSSEDEHDEGNSEYRMWLCIGGVLGFSTCFWGIIGTLVLNRHWRHAYYLSLHNLKERIYVAMAVRIGRSQRNFRGDHVLG